MKQPKLDIKTERTNHISDMNLCHVADLQKNCILIANYRYSFSPKARQILSYLLSLVPSDIESENETIQIKTNLRTLFAICSLSDPDTEKSYGIIKDILKELSQRVMWLRSDQYETTVQWISKVQINTVTGLVTVWMPLDLLTYAQKCQELLPSRLILNMKCLYSLRLLILLHDKDSPVKLSVEMLKAHLLSGNRKSYDHFKDFRRSVLEPAICEINETGLYHIAMEACYTGRRISHVLFHMEKLMPEEDAVHLVDTSNNTTKQI